MSNQYMEEIDKLLSNAELMRFVENNTIKNFDSDLLHIHLSLNNIKEQFSLFTSTDLRYSELNYFVLLCYKKLFYITESNFLEQKAELITDILMLFSKYCSIMSNDTGALKRTTSKIGSNAYTQNLIIIEKNLFPKLIYKYLTKQTMRVIDKKIKTNGYSLFVEFHGGEPASYEECLLKSLKDRPELIKIDLNIIDIHKVILEIYEEFFNIVKNNPEKYKYKDFNKFDKFSAYIESKSKKNKITTVVYKRIKTHIEQLVNY